MATHPRFFAVMFSGFVLPFAASAQQTFQGADAILQRVAQAAAQAPAAPKPEDLLPAFRAKLEAFSREAQDLPAAEAASRWVTLFDAYRALPPAALQTGSYRDRLSMASLFQVLPPSAAWDDVVAALEQRAAQPPAVRGASLRLLASVLRARPDERRQAMAAFDAEFRKLPDGDSSRSFGENLIAQLKMAVEDLEGGAGNRVEVFEKQLADAEKGSQGQQFGGSLEVPDLVRLAGEEKALALIPRLFALNVEFSVGGKATRRLAAELALQQVDRLRRPLWALVTGPEQLALYEAMAAKFPAAERDYARREVDAIFLLSLISVGRSADAAAFVTANTKRLGELGLLHSDAFTALSRQGFPAQVLSFLRESLQRDPGLPFWTDFIQLSAREGASAAALELVKKTLANPALTPEVRVLLQDRYVAAVLAVDDVEEGVRMLRELVKKAPAGGPTTEADLDPTILRQLTAAGVKLTPEMLRGVRQTKAGSEGRNIERTLQLARVGRLLGRAELVDEGLAAARAAFAETPATGYTSDLLIREFVGRLLDENRAPEAEAAVADALVKAATPPGERSYGPDRRQQPLLLELAGIYHRTGRSADVRRLLDAAPNWGAADLAQLPPSEGKGASALVIAAKALADLGRIDEARKIVRRAVQTRPGSDRGYELLVALGGEGLLPFLDTLAAADRFEERPLIWKARLQLDAGSLDEAEKTVRAAIAIDPSDGEQGHGDRMRAYAVLGDILEKKGDVAQARQMRAAVSAIRLSEKADDWWESGLLTRAVKLYEEALGLFADAYCIQSRLALRYTELGDFARAEEHYRRAFELMPESFGRVESHCFGCEGAFAGERAQSIAGRVFTALAEKFPQRAQVFYLFGYLQQAEGRFEEAAANFRKATDLDPDYLNAWEKWVGLREQIDLPAADLEAASFALLRLDPAGKRASLPPGAARDLRKLWDTILAVRRASPPVEAGPIYPLAASAAALAAKKAGPDEDDVSFDLEDFSTSRDVRNHFTGHAAISSLGYVLDTVGRKEE